MMTAHDKLLHALTDYDRKQMTKRGYNMYALPQYIGRLQEVDADVTNGADLRAALTVAFSGRLLDVCLKAVGLAKSTDAEQRSGMFYTPASSK